MTRRPAPDYPRYRVGPGEPPRLADRDPADTGGYKCKEEAKAPLAAQRERIADLQARLYAERRCGVLIVFQAMDAGGKDGAINSVFRGVNPHGCVVWSFKTPSAEEQAHDFLWRYHCRAPARGTVTIFNRSHYEDVLVPRVRRLVEERVWRARLGIIRDFEHGLAHDTIVIVKFFLHISRERQRQRLQRRLSDPAECWKFDARDLRDRALWGEYHAAYEDVITATSVSHAPWYVVPGDHTWFRNLVIARIIADTLAALDPRYPPCDSRLAATRLRD